MNAAPGNTSAYTFLAWASFMVSTVGMLLGIVYLPAQMWVKGYFGIGYLFTVVSCLNLAKSIRDKHEETRFINRINDAKTEKLLKDFEKVV